MHKIYAYFLPFCAIMLTGSLFAGNPDRQGEAGANQLLINPWARTAGLHSMNTAYVSGADAIYLNVAGLSRITKTQIQIGHTRYLEGADININALSFAQKVGNGAFGVSLVSFDLGDIETTTEDVPGGSGATYSPAFFNMTLSYSYIFSNRVSVGVSAKFVNESLTNVGARAVALDAGVQYVTGEKDRFKFGISLRNVGSKMRFTGEGLSTPRPNPSVIIEYPITYYQRSAAYELPSQLNIGISYDWPLGQANRLTMVTNFTSNSFSRDQVGAGLEFAIAKNFALRAGYKYEFDAGDEATLDNGIAAGFTFSVPVKKDSDTRFAIDYAYRQTDIFKGIHNIGVRLDL